MNLNFLKRIFNILLIPPLLFFANQLSGQCDVFIEPGSIEVVDNGTGVQFIFDVTNNSSVEYDGGDLNMAWTLNGLTFPATIWEIDFTTNTNATSIQPGETRTLRTPWLDIPNLPSWFPSNPNTPGSNFELWVDALEWPFWSANPNGFNGSWDEVKLFLDDCDPEYVYNDDGSFYYGPTDSDCPNVNGDQFCDCEIDFIDFNHYTYEATLEINGWQNCATPLNNGSTGNIDNINSVVFGIHIPEWDYGWGDCVGNDDDTYPGWTFALFNNLNIDSPETVVIDIGNSSASVIPCWIEILETPELPCREIVIWQINFSRTARIEDFPDEGWVSNPFLNASTSPYPDINIPNNRITYCNTPNAFPPNNQPTVDCIDNEPIFEYDVRVNNNGLDTLFDYCVEIPELNYDECFSASVNALYEIPPNQGQYLGTVTLPSDISEFTVIVYNAEDELDEFFFDNQITITVDQETNTDCDIFGCTDPDAENYDPSSTIDDGSCIVFSDLGLDDMTIVEFDCDIENPYSWQGTLVVTNYGDNPVTEFCAEFSPISTTFETDTFCYDNLNILPGETMEFELPVSEFNLGNVAITLLDVNGVNENESVIYGNDENFLNNASTYSIIYFCEGCTDPEANNYNPNAMFSDGSCEYEEISDIGVDSLGYQLGGCFGEPLYWIPEINITNYGDVTVTELCLEFYIWNVAGVEPDTLCFDNLNILPGQFTVLELPQNYNGGDDLLFVQTTIISSNGTLESFQQNNTLNSQFIMWCYDCIDPDAENYNEFATNNQDPNNCEYLGCTDWDANNYDPQATIDDGSCEYLGCTDSSADNYDPNANVDDGSCEYLGCTDNSADNYDPNANVDDGSCEYLGCTDPQASNYDSQANVDDGSCEYLGCTDPQASNYDPQATINDGSCDYLGCTDSNALNYDPQATIDDGSCLYDILGCTDPNADNYDPDATIDNNSCIYFGCTDPEAFNYDPTANTDDNSCMYYGCTDPDADNYDPNADINDGSCQYLGCTDSEALNYDPDANVDDGNCVYPPYIDPCDDADIYVPNTFTPDNDGLNDVWFVSTTPDCWRSFDIRVYDRWGQLVWQTENVNDVWLGGFTGGTHFVADGIYIYQIIAHKWNTEVHQSSGFVTIIR